MATNATETVAEAAKRIYEKRLKQTLEQTNSDAFVALEPVSGDHFLGQTISEALGASRAQHPDKMAHALRVGHAAAIEFGMHVR